MHLLRMKSMTYDFLQMGINTETANMLIIHLVQVLYQTALACQDKPDEMRKIKNTLDTMGLPFILSHINVENILKMRPGAAKEGVQSGGSPRRMTPAQFMSFMGIKQNKSSPLFRKMARQATTKKRGGGRGDPGDCGGRCSRMTPCQNAACLKCVDGICKLNGSPPPEEVVPLGDAFNHDVLGVIVRRSTNPGVLDLAVRGDAAKKLLDMLRENQVAIDKQSGDILAAFIDRHAASQASAKRYRDDTAGELTRLKAELAEMIEKARKEHNGEFDAILNPLVKKLKAIKYKEYAAGGLGAVAGVVALNLCRRMLDNTANRLYTFLYWILLAGQSVLKYIPLLNVIKVLDTTCFGSPAPSPIDGAIFPRLVQTNNTVTTYDYTWQRYGFGAPENYYNQSICPGDGPWWNSFGYKVGNCVAKNGFELITTCTTAGIQFFGMDVDITILTMILGSVVGALFFYLTWRICTLQTPVFEFDTIKDKSRRGDGLLGTLRLPWDMFKDTAKFCTVATVSGAYVMALMDGETRSTLASNVANREIPFEGVGHPVNRGEFIALREKEFVDEVRYKQLVELIAQTQARLATYEQVLVDSIKDCDESTLRVANQLVEFRKGSESSIAQLLPAIMNGVTYEPYEPDAAAQPQQPLLLGDGSSSSHSSHSSPAPSPPKTAAAAARPAAVAAAAADDDDDDDAAAAAADAAAAAAPKTKSRKGSRKDGGRRKRVTRRSIRHRRRLSRHRK
jgi:hypothetical protein